VTPEGELAVDSILREFDRLDGILDHELWTVPLTPWWKAIATILLLGGQ
jgi:hypothetical protein